MWHFLVAEPINPKLKIIVLMSKFVKKVLTLIIITTASFLNVTKKKLFQNYPIQDGCHQTASVKVLPFFCNFKW